MKRLHVNLTVADLDASVGFYSSLFGAQPALQKPDYAKWMLDDPRVNFAITSRGAQKGIDHLGIQVDNRDELAEIRQRLQAAKLPLLDSGATTCCYAHSEKHWSHDPQGTVWETFLTGGESAHYDGDEPSSRPGDNACCDRAATGADTAAAPCCAATP